MFPSLAHAPTFLRLGYPCEILFSSQGNKDIVHPSQSVFLFQSSGY